MQVQGQNGSQQRGIQGRPAVQVGRGEALIRQLMEERREEIEGLFAKDDNPKASYTRAVGLAVTTYKVSQSNSPNQPIDEASVVQAALYAFQRKLDPGTDVYFVPYKGKVQAITSPGGLINAAYRSGVVGAIDARVVFKKEVAEGLFDHELGSTRWVKHKKGACARPVRPEEAWRELAFAYAIVDIKGASQPVIEVLDKSEIEYYRSLSPSANSPAGLWGKFPAEAARKAALKQALGRVPKQSEVSEILAYESAAESEADAAVERIAELVNLGADGAAAPAAGQPATTGQPQARGSDRGAGEPAGRNLDPHAGDPRAIFIPGKKGSPKVADAEDKDLVYWEGRMRGDFEAGKWEGDQYAGKNFTQLATIRAEMRARNLSLAANAALDGAPADVRAPDTSAGELSREEEETLFGSSGSDGTAEYGS